MDKDDIYPESLANIANFRWRRKLRHYCPRQFTRHGRVLPQGGRVHAHLRRCAYR